MFDGLNWNKGMVRNKQSYWIDIGDENNVLQKFKNIIMF